MASNLILAISAPQRRRLTLSLPPHPQPPTPIASSCVSAPPLSSKPSNLSCSIGWQTHALCLQSQRERFLCRFTVAEARRRHGGRRRRGNHTGRRTCLEFSHDKCAAQTLRCAETKKKNRKTDAVRCCLELATGAVAMAAARWSTRRGRCSAVTLSGGGDGHHGTGRSVTSCRVAGAEVATRIWKPAHLLNQHPTR